MLVQIQLSVKKPIGINAVNTWSLPLFGTILLLSSGFILTWGHHALICGKKDEGFIGILLSAILGFIFCYVQFLEYSYSEFTISDSIFGSIFFITTGLHFIHVIIGALFLTICAIRLYFDNITAEHHLGFEFSVIYYHLVDLIWLILYVIFYWWGG